MLILEDADNLKCLDKNVRVKSYHCNRNLFRHLAASGEGEINLFNFAIKSFRAC